MNKPDRSESTALQKREPAAGEIYSIETVVQLTLLTRHQIGVYCRHGLIAPVSNPEQDGWWFDQEAIRELRRLERLRDEYRMNLAAVRLTAELLREVEQLREEVRRLRRVT